MLPNVVRKCITDSQILCDKGLRRPQSSTNVAVLPPGGNESDGPRDMSGPTVNQPLDARQTR